ncbi:DUF4097 family beta strand repeat-containing protein [Bailinhaonella thermotolerans]|uniref:DUF4097 domain-containing protein n=1 Tax=Bailinhaonella thermotolerans TaxID=1070861 RepID=A0A3A4AUH4_9ACTN|nr:DUF4097 family beta strand repeat-containing protein [Bailinhaonella thermotolerans]RJL23182.1 hypothetical protein D5H75_32905 [Bailinhaonella thermotolerans]
MRTTLTVSGLDSRFLYGDVRAGDVEITTADAAEDRIEVRITATGDFVPAAAAAVLERCDGAASLIIPRAQENARGRMTTTITIPADVRTDLTCAGDITAGRLRDTRLRTTAGNIQISRLAGTSDLVTEDGQVRLGRTAGTTRVYTETGAIDVRRTSGRTELNTASGNVRVRRGEGELTVRTATGPIQAGKVSGYVELSSGSGRIDVHASLPRTLDTRTTSGDVTFRGRYGATLIHARTDSGHLTFHGVYKAALIRADNASGSTAFRGRYLRRLTFLTSGAAPVHHD